MNLGGWLDSLGDARRKHRRTRGRLARACGTGRTDRNPTSSLKKRNAARAKSRVLSRQFASSCAYMSTYSPVDDDVMLGYLRGFNMETHPGSGVDRASRIVTL